MKWIKNILRWKEKTKSVQRRSGQTGFFPERDAGTIEEKICRQTRFDSWK